MVVVRGAGDIATGVIQKLVHAGFAVVALEMAHPMAIRWRAALSPTVQRGRWQVEDLTGVRAADWTEASALLASGTLGTVPVLVDPDAAVLAEVTPWALVDAVLAKRNVGTRRAMAPVTVGLGPGFSAGDDVDYVVETMRGHDLGRVIASGPALPNTGIPGLIAGRAAERVLHSPIAGVVEVRRGIGDVVTAGQVVCVVHGDTDAEVTSAIDGVIRGMIPDGFVVPARFKIADVDPRVELASACDTISDKSRAIGGGALDAVLQGLRAAGHYQPPPWRP
nr:EF2563 family selenium-dependent molybdenum hydroxylase system protein [Propionibacterium sp.]